MTPPASGTIANAAVSLSSGLVYVAFVSFESTMPIRYKLNTIRRLKTVDFVDRVTEKEFADYRKTLSEHEMRQYDVAYIDLGGMTDCDFGYGDVRPHANHVSESRGENSRFIEIVWAPADLAYGLARMYQSLVESNIDVRLFRDETEARNALDEALD